MLQVRLVACATVVEELRPRLPAGTVCQTLDFGLHRNARVLQRMLQEAIDGVVDADVVVLGYGLCSQAVVGLASQRCTLVVPRVDDCIGLFLGSREAHLLQSSTAPGTYYLTKGWIEAGDSPFGEYERVLERYGPDKARRIFEVYLRNYTRLALINTGQRDLERYRDYTRRTAQRFGLRYEEIEGSSALVEKMVRGPWDAEFVVAPPGKTISFEDFFPNGF